MGTRRYGVQLAISGESAANEGDGVENKKRNSISTSNHQEIIYFYTTFSCSHLLFVYYSYGHNRPLLTRKVDFTNERKSRVHNPRKKGRKVHRQ